MSSPTQRSLALLRGQGYLCYVAERWNQYARKRQDMYGFVDIVAVRADTVGVLGVQTTSAANQAARLKKLSALPAAAVWLAAGNRCEQRRGARHAQAQARVRQDPKGVRPKRKH